MSAQDIDRLGKAMFTERFRHYVGEQWDRTSESDRSNHRDMVRAVLMEMRTPTDDMLEAAYRVKKLGADLHDFVVHDCAPDIWAAMIDELLEG